MQNTSFFAVGSEMFLNESSQNKQTVQQAFLDGLNKGVIKPFPCQVVTSSLSGGKMFESMKYITLYSNQLYCSITIDSCLI